MGDGMALAKNYISKQWLKKNKICRKSERKNYEAIGSRFEQMNKSKNGIKPFLFLAGTFLLFITSIVLMGIFPPKIEFFPDNEPQQILVYLEYPEGTDIEKTNETLKQIESEIYDVINNPKYLDGDYNFLVESAISQVGEGAGNLRQMLVEQERFLIKLL